MAAVININGKKYSGNSIVIDLEGNVNIDGNLIELSEKKISIKVEGNLENLNVSKCDTIQVTGNCNEVNSLSGYLSVSGNITGNINTVSGEVKCRGRIAGTVQTVSGSIKSSL